MEIYSVRDRLTGILNLNMDQNNQVAKRGFLFAVSQNKEIIGFRPGDFELIRLGSIDTSTSHIDLLPMPELVARGDDLKEE